MSKTVPDGLSSDELEKYLTAHVDPIERDDVRAAYSAGQGQPSGSDALDTGKLHRPALADYIANADARVQTGFRIALETLGVPLPDYAQRKPTGPRVKIMREIAAINGEQYRPERPR